MDSVRKAVVALVLFDKNNPNSGSRSTGYIYRKNDHGLLIITTSHQLRIAFKKEDPVQIPKSRMGVYVEFFDRTTVMYADVLHFDMVKDLTVIIVKSCDQLKIHPIDCIEPISFSEDLPSPGLSVYTYHHPQMVDIATCAPVIAFNQYSDGFIVDDSHLNPEIVNYHIPLIFPGSSGAPVLGKNSNKLVSMIVGCWGLHNVRKGAHANTNWGEVHNIHYGPTVAKIQYFLNEAETANTSTSTNPTTEADQAGQTGTDSDMVDLTIVDAWTEEKGDQMVCC